ncbi:MAG: hypothetical protein ACREKL_08150 [Chthoniobacterales bacterium]
MSAASTAEKPGFIKRIFRGRMLVVSIALHLLFALGATYFIVQRFQAKRPVTFQGGAPNPSARPLEHKVQMARKQQTMSAPKQAKRIATTALAKVTLPDMPTIPVPSTELNPNKMAGVGGQGMATSGGGAVGGGAGSGTGTIVPLFGMKSPGTGALVGTFYDLKQDKDGKRVDMNENAYKATISEYVLGGFNESVLEKFYKGPTPLYAPQIFIPTIDAGLAPRSFHLAGVKPGMWLIHYKGRVIPPESGTYHFVGVGDDYLLVRFNGKIVLEHGSVHVSDINSQVKYFYDIPRDSATGKDWYSKTGHAVGYSVEASADTSYPIDIIIGEMPGIDFRAQVMIMKEGVDYKKDERGNPIVPVFRLAPSSLPTPKSAAVPPVDREGPIWRMAK